MKLGEFIKNFSHNNIVRLLYRIPGGHEIVNRDWDQVSMDHEILKGKGVNRHYIDNEVLGLASIYINSGNYPEAVNIVIERLDVQPLIEETTDNSMFESKCDEM